MSELRRESGSGRDRRVAASSALNSMPWRMWPSDFSLVQGATIVIPVENRGSVRAGVLNFSVPGGFEPSMPAIHDWFREHPPRDTKS